MCWVTVWDKGQVRVGARDGVRVHLLLLLSAQCVCVKVKKVHILDSASS